MASKAILFFVAAYFVISANSSFLGQQSEDAAAPT
jgi:hypothetical protein